MNNALPETLYSDKFLKYAQRKYYPGIITLSNQHLTALSVINSRITIHFMITVELSTKLQISGRSFWIKALKPD